ncbi:MULTISPECIES: glycosyltransferase [unclassified Guyparkeria]|uniref:glycosyltransferase family 2 protein n=1 Tax=unclassified Guyparkeria TaxID=2626246 RepID=UPI0018D23FBF|nr:MULTISPECIES: glycosyltransferase [unclassified Guyparkeria]
MTSPLVSVCIANFNGEGVLPDCIDSVLEQQGDIAVEILVHDDASTDSSIELLASRYPRDRHPEIRLLESDQNVGFCVSNNRLVENARGKYILLLNNDAALAPDALSTLLRAAEQQSPPGILTLPQIDWESGQLVDRGCLLDPFYNPIPNLDPRRKDVAYVIGACLWAPKRLWNEVGGFPEWFESIGEDLQLCCRARLQGNTVQVTTSSHYRHHQGISFGGNKIRESRLSTTFRRRRLSERNKTYALILCTPLSRIWFILPTHLTLLAAEGAALTLVKRDLTVWKEIYGNVFSSVYRNHCRLMEERKHIQQARTATATEYARSFLWLPRKLQMLFRHGLPRLTR